MGQKQELGARDNGIQKHKGQAHSLLLLEDVPKSQVPNHEGCPVHLLKCCHQKATECSPSVNYYVKKGLEMSTVFEYMSRPK